jgi:hypothetical protein
LRPLFCPSIFAPNRALRTMNCNIDGPGMLAERLDQRQS